MVKDENTVEIMELMENWWMWWLTLD